MVIKSTKSIAPLLGVPVSTLKRELSQDNPKKYPVVKEGGRYFMYLEDFEAWKKEAALKDAGSVYDAFLRNVYELERIAPQIGLLADADQHTLESAVSLTDCLDYELRRVRRLLWGAQRVGYLNRGELARDVQSAIDWSGIENLDKNDPKASKEIKAILAALAPVCEYFGIEVAV